MVRSYFLEFFQSEEENIFSFGERNLFFNFDLN